MEFHKGMAGDMAEEYSWNGVSDSHMEEEVGQDSDIDRNLSYPEDGDFDMLDAQLDKCSFYRKSGYTKVRSQKLEVNTGNFLKIWRVHWIQRTGMLISTGSHWDITSLHPWETGCGR